MPSTKHPKRRRPLAVFKRDNGHHFYLFPERLVQDISLGYGIGWKKLLYYREVRRTDIARLFNMEPFQGDGTLTAGGYPIGTRMLDIPGRYSDEVWRPYIWTAVVGPDYKTGGLSIGCQYFNREEAKKIRRWALRKRKK